MTFDKDITDQLEQDFFKRAKYQEYFYPELKQFLDFESTFIIEEFYKEIYNKEREKTLHLYMQIVPFQIASKIHDGEKCHSFSATIGSVLSVIITNYNNCLQNIDLRLASEVIFKTLS